jgi:hypothetical protein
MRSERVTSISGENEMEVIYRANKSLLWEYPDLTDGKKYEVVDTIKDDNGNITHYWLVDDDPEPVVPDCAYPYEVEIFDEMSHL